MIYQIAYKLLASLYHRQTQYILLKMISPQFAAEPDTVAAESLGLTCTTVESADALQAGGYELAPSFRDSVARLQDRLRHGCVVFLAHRPRAGGAGQEVIGYSLSERGVFSALGRREKISPNILFNHYMEVLPQYRGLRVTGLLWRAEWEYCRVHGMTKRYTVVLPANVPAMRSSLRVGLLIVGTVTRVSAFRGLWVWETPWERIEQALSAEEPLPVHYRLLKEGGGGSV